MKKHYLLLLTFLAFVGVLQILSAKDKAAGLELGAKIPELKVTTQHGKEIPLAAAEGNKWVFVFFYPKALTGG